MKSLSASRKFLPRRPDKRSAKASADRTNERADPVCRGHGKNSDTPTVRPGNGNGFLAVVRPATVEIFYTKTPNSPRAEPLSRREPEGKIGRASCREGE